MAQKKSTKPILREIPLEEIDLPHIEMRSWKVRS